MICDLWENLPRYKGLLPALDAVIDAMAGQDMEQLALGQTVIDGERAFVNVQEPTFKARSQAKWECHRLYADLQLLISGSETIDYLPIAQVEDWGEFPAGKDIAQSPDPQPGAQVALIPGQFMLLFPWDAHRPGIGKGKGRKAVFKLHM